MPIKCTNLILPESKIFELLIKENTPLFYYSSTLGVLARRFRIEQSEIIYIAKPCSAAGGYIFSKILTPFTDTELISHLLIESEVISTDDIYY
ncbi:MAG: hypothetical protein K0R50_2716 [Eubacterium sp.]|jgi:hypothetical protein|nr:hypothetical protein [Eubacterium sp.]